MNFLFSSLPNPIFPATATVVPNLSITSFSQYSSTSLPTSSLHLSFEYYPAVSPSTWLHCIVGLEQSIVQESRDMMMSKVDYGIVLSVIARPQMSISSSTQNVGSLDLPPMTNLKKAAVACSCSRSLFKQFSREPADPWSPSSGSSQSKYISIKSTTCIVLVPKQMRWEPQTSIVNLTLHLLIVLWTVAS